MPESGNGKTYRRPEIEKTANPWKAESLSARQRPEWGTPLTDDDYRMLEASWITPEPKTTTVPSGETQIGCTNPALSCSGESM